MSAAIASLPWWLTWPSYRTLGTIVLFFLSVVIAFLYLLLGRFLAYLFGSRKVDGGGGPLFSRNEDSKLNNSNDIRYKIIRNSLKGENSNSIGTEIDLKKNR